MRLPISNSPPAGWIAQTRWAWNASEPMSRIAARLAVLSIALGVIGFLLGVISLVLALMPAGGASG